MLGSGVSKERLGGIPVLDAGDLNHAVHLMSKHPSLHLGGCVEVRPAEELNPR